MRCKLRIFSIFMLIILNIMLIFGFASCESGRSGSEENENSGDSTVSRLMNFTLSEDETYYILSYVDQYGHTEEEKENFVIPSEYKGLPVREIGDEALKNVPVVNVTVPDSITVIGKSAFSGCSELRSIQLPESMDSIGEYAFFGCHYLYHIDIPIMQTINENAFAWTGLRNVVVPEGVEVIGDRAFASNLSLSSISLPSTLVSIGKLGWSNVREVYNYSSVEIPEDDDYEIYDGMPEYSKLSVSDEGFTFYEEGDGYVLLNYEGDATDIILPRKYNDSTYRINKYAFCFCEHIVSMVIPDSVISVGYAIFYECAESGDTTIQYIYCEATEKPDGWDAEWNLVQLKTPQSILCEDGEQVFWGNEWEYVDGDPVMK